RRPRPPAGPLGADPGQLDQLVDGLGDLAAVVLEQVGGRPLDRPGLVAEEPGGVDGRLDLGPVGDGQVGRGGAGAGGSPWMDRALLRKSRVAWMPASTSARSATARSAGVGQRRNSSGVTWLTTTSVDCADRMVATSSSQAERWARAVVTMGERGASRARISGARAGRAALDSRRRRGAGLLGEAAMAGW